MSKRRRTEAPTTGVLFFVVCLEKPLKTLAIIATGIDHSPKVKTLAIIATGIDNSPKVKTLDYLPPQASGLRQSDPRQLLAVTPGLTPSQSRAGAP